MKAKDAIKQIREEEQPPVETPAAAAPPTAAAAPAEPAAPVAEGTWEPWMQRLLEVARAKFIDERVKGFTHPGTGQTFGPVPQEQAEARWAKAEPKFKAIIQSDPDVRAKFGMTPDPTAPPETDEPVAEPPLPEEPPASDNAAPPVS